MPADFEISPLIPERQEPVRPVVPPAVSPPASSPPISMGAPTSHRMLKWLMLTGALLFVLAIASLWWGGNSFSDSNVIVTITAPDHAISGDQITYHVAWRNNTRVELTNLSFRLFYPVDTIAVGANGSPVASESVGFVIDSVSPGASQSRDFSVILVGDKGEIKTARLNLIFQAGTFRSSFQKEISAPTTITDLPVSLTLVAPPNVTPGQSIDYILDVRNDTLDDLSALKVRFTYPEGFTPQKFNPQPARGFTEWDIARLNAGDGARIRVSGTLSGNAQETKTVAATLQRELNGKYVDYVKTNSFTMLSSPLLSVSIQPDGGRDYVAFAGDRLRYVVSYRNSSQYTLVGAMMAVKLEGDMYDFSGLQVNGGFFNDATHTLLFDASGFPEFGALPPGKNGTLTFTIPLKSGVAAGQLGGAKTLFVKASATLSTPNIPSGADPSAVTATDSVVTKIGSQPTISQAILFDGGAGTGPLPAQVGQTTTFTVRWQLVNPGNDVKDSKVTATLAPGVTWAGSPVAVHGGTAPVFNASNNTVTWTVGTLPFGTGNGTARYEATFRVSITPSSNQVGQPASLIGSAVLAGTDSFTSQPVAANAQSASTNSVEGHTNDGRVVQ